MPGKQAHNERKLKVAKAVLEHADMPAIRRQSLANMERWISQGVWVSAFDEWKILMERCSDAEVIAVMTGEDENSTRLRQSPPYTGILPAEVRARIYAGDDEELYQYFMSRKDFDYSKL